MSMTNEADREDSQWEMVIGLEVHAQIASVSKLFSSSSTTYGKCPNSQVSLVDAAMPGMLPTVNKECVRLAVRTGLGLNAQINLRSRFDRKSYYYPDLPQGYQISQFHHPVVSGGHLQVKPRDGEPFRVRIERIHLEQDAGKSIHDQDPLHTLVDLNRSGVGLMEIVTYPDMRSAAQACAFVTKLRMLLRYLGTSDADMEKGNLRADVNVSVRPRGSGNLGTRCEIKNVNSIRFIGQAIKSEARRQIDILESGGCIEQQTRSFSPATGETRAMRSKEEAHDYRYFPDPDLPPLDLTEKFVDAERRALPELPDARQHRFEQEFSLSPYDAALLVDVKERAEYFEALCKNRDPKQAANWVCGAVLAALNREQLELTDIRMKPETLGEILDMVAEGEISGKIAKDVFEIAWEREESPRQIVKQRGLKQVTDPQAISEIIQRIIDENPSQVAAFRKKPTVMGWFVGQVMKDSSGKANPKVVSDLLRDRLKQEEE